MTIELTKLTKRFGTLTAVDAIDLSVGDVRVPIDLGRVPSGSSLEESIDLSLGEGVTEFSGALLIGP